MITVVSGLPRSGTSLMMQMLAAAGLELATDDVRSPDGDNPKGYFELDAVKRIRQDDSFLRDLPGKAVKIVAPLLTSLPSTHDYRIIFMERDLDEVLASQAAMLRRSGEGGTGATDRALRSAYQSQLEKIKEWIAEQPNISMLFVAHRRVVEDPNTAAEAVLAFLEAHAGNLERDCNPRGTDSRMAAMVSVVDKSLHRHSENACA